MQSILQSQLRRSLYSFLIKSFTALNPGKVLQKNWHIEFICDVLEACSRGEIKRLIVNLPPRYLKSHCVSVAFPAWLLGVSPNKRIIVCSYSQRLSTKHSKDCRRIMKTDWYGDTFIDSVISYGDDTKTRFGTKLNGYYFSTSTLGTLIGEGGDVLIIDDPQIPEMINKARSRKRVTNWFNESLMSRLNDKKNGVVILVMQRLHREDLAGYLLKESNDWFHINLPAISPKEQDIVFGQKIYKTRKKGELLHPDRDCAETLLNMKRMMGYNVFVAQYQQNPINTREGLVKESWLARYDALQVIEGNLGYYISIDCAKGVREENDYTAIVVIAQTKEGKHLLIDMIRDRFTYPSLRKIVRLTIEKFKPKITLIEDSSSGSSLIQELKYMQFRNIVGIRAKGDKVSRFNHTLVAIESGKLLFPKDAIFLDTLVSEVLSFPFGKHDDQVDAISQYFSWLSAKHSLFAVPQIRTL